MATAAPIKSNGVNRIDRAQSEVKLATVYMSSAELTRIASVDLQKGKNEVIFRGLSAKIDKQSLQVAVLGKATILSISSKVDIVDKNLYKLTLQGIKDSVRLLTDRKDRLEGTRDVYEKEKEMLVKNNAIETDGRALNSWAEELRNTADFYRKRIQEINTYLLTSSKTLRELDDELEVLENRKTEIAAKALIPTSIIKVYLEAKTRAKCSLGLRYLVGDASWSPNYNIRAMNIEEDVNLEYKAQICNDTGVNWKNISLRLSTAEPEKGMGLPELNTWTIDFKEDVAMNSAIKAPKKAKYFQTYKRKGESDYNKSTVLSDSIYHKNSYQEIKVAELNTEFEIEDTHSIASGNEPYIVDVADYELPATFQHYCVPKVDKGVFILAKVTAWDNFDLIDGLANVYYQKAYVGQLHITNQGLKDTLRLSLGRDSKVLVSRTQIKDEHFEKSMRNNAKETMSYEIIVKNNRQEPINIEIQDQVPVSNDEHIEIKVLETSDAIVDKYGKLVWKHWLQPTQDKRNTVSFSVKYPKGREVSFQKTRSVATSQND